MQHHLKIEFGMALVVLWSVGCAAASPSPSTPTPPSPSPSAFALPSPSPSASALPSPSSSATAPATVGSAQRTNTPLQGMLGGGGKKIGDYTVTLFSTPNPPVRGSNTLEALVVDVNSQPVTDATVSFDIDMTNMSHGKNVVTAKLAGNGRYAGTLFFQMPGPWRVNVTVEHTGQLAVSDRFNFSVH